MHQILSSTFLFLTLSCLAFDAMGDAAFAKAMAYAPPVETAIADVKNHLSDTAKKRTLSDDELKVQKLILLAEEMHVEKIVANHGNLSQITSQNVANSMILKMKQDPKWEKSLPNQNMTTLKKMSDSLKLTFTDKTYAWAWFQKQFGETQVAKQILQNLFKEAYEKGTKITHKGFGYHNPLTELGDISSALGPLSTAEEKRDIETKVQKIKTIYSHLPNSNIMT